MTAIDLEQARISVDKVFRSVLNGEDVIITEHEKPVLKITRIESSSSGFDEFNALEKLRKIRISATSDFSTKAELYPSSGNDE